MNVQQAIESRHSVCAYKAQTPKRNELIEVLEAARNAPSAVNKQPWRFVCVTNTSTLEVIQQAYARDWFQTAPCVIVCLANHAESWHRASDGKDHADIDLAIAIDHLTLRATEIGLATCWVCNFDTAKIRQALHLSEALEPVALVPIGYADETDVRPRIRKPASEVYSIIE